MRSLGLLLILVSAAACKPKEYVCQVRQECVAANGGYGLCVTSHCAFVDQTCSSGWRYDDTAGAQAKMCVDSAALTADAGPSAIDAAPATADAAASTADAAPSTADAAPSTADAATHD